MGPTYGASSFSDSIDVPFDIVRFFSFSDEVRKRVISWKRVGASSDGESESWPFPETSRATWSVS